MPLIDGWYELNFPSRDQIPDDDPDCLTDDFDYDEPPDYWDEPPDSRE